MGSNWRPLSFPSVSISTTSGVTSRWPPTDASTHQLFFSNLTSTRTRTHTHTHGSVYSIYSAVINRHGLNYGWDTGQKRWAAAKRFHSNISTKIMTEYRPLIHHFPLLSSIFYHILLLFVSNFRSLFPDGWKDGWKDGWMDGWMVDIFRITRHDWNFESQSARDEIIIKPRNRRQMLHAAPVPRKTSSRR